MSQVGYGVGGCGCSPKATSSCKSEACIVRKLKGLQVDVWDDPGCATDNVVRIYNKTDCVEHEGYMYWPKEDMTISMPPSPDWTVGKTVCEALKPPEKCGGDLIDGPVVQCDQLGEGLWWNPDTGQYEVLVSSIPTGCQEFVSSVVGTYVTDLGTATPYLATEDNNYFEAHPRGVLSYSATDYPYLSVAGREMCVTFNSNMGYAITDVHDTIGVSSEIQTGLGVWINGEYQHWPDGYFVNGDGQDHESGTSNCLCFETTGGDIDIEVVRWIRTDIRDGNGDGDVLDYTGSTVYVDVAEITGVFSAKSSV